MPNASGSKKKPSKSVEVKFFVKVANYYWQVSENEFKNRFSEGSFEFEICKGGHDGIDEVLHKEKCSLDKILQESIRFFEDIARANQSMIDFGDDIDNTYKMIISTKIATKKKV